MRTVKSAAFLIVVLGCLFTAPTTKATTTAAPGATTAAPGATTAAPGATTAAPGATTAAPGATTAAPGATPAAPGATTAAPGATTAAPGATTAAPGATTAAPGATTAAPGATTAAPGATTAAPGATTAAPGATTAAPGATTAAPGATTAAPGATTAAPGATTAAPGATTAAPGATTAAPGATTAAPGATTAAPGATTAAPGATTAAPGATTAAPGATTAAPGATTAAPGATTPSPGATTTAPSATTPPPATITPAQTTPSAVTTPPPGDVTTPPPPPITVTFTFQRNNQFTCRRPTTRCSSFGFCQRDTGRCFCVNGAYGLQCQIPGAIPQNGGACQTSNPCERGICYDNGLGARCVCPDGFYGGRCQHRMVYVQCHPNGMLVNVFPYGFSERLWYYRRPPTLSRCRIPTVAAFTARWPQFRSRGWRGYAGAYYHRNDPCGRNALVTETATTISYSRDLYIPYGNDDRHFTDTIIRITCNIPKTPPPPPSDQPTLPPAQVAYTVIDQTGQPVRGNVQRGTTIGLYFRVQPVPNSGGITDIRVNRCVITNGVNSIVIAENGCARPPIGRALLKPARGSNVLWISTADFPQGSLNWNFRCRVRTCTSTDLRCRLPFSCETRRKRRAIRRRTEDDENTVVVSSHFTFAN